VGQSTVDLEKEINSGKVIICNLSKGKFGPKSSQTLGKLLIALIQCAVRKRQILPIKDRMDTFLFVDEFQNFINPTFEEILTESRKYALYTVLANQVLGHEMSTELKRIIMANTSIKVAAENEHDGLKAMINHMHGVNIDDFVNLPKYSFYVHNDNRNKNKTNLLKVPDFLVKKKAPFYLKKKELKELFLYMVHESGYYVKTSIGKSPDPVYSQKECG